MPEAEGYAAEVLKFNSQQRMARIVLGLKDFRERPLRRGAQELRSRRPTRRWASSPRGCSSPGPYAGEGDLNAALKALDRLDSNESFANFKTFHSALIADYLGNAIRAEASYRKAYEETSSSLRIVQAYGNFLERNGRAAEAQKIYRAFLDNDENPLILAALDNSVKNVKPQPFIPSPGRVPRRRCSRSPPR